MDSLLIVGVDTVAGANVAATLAERYRVSTWSTEPKYEIADCMALDPDATPDQVIACCDPDWIIHCGPAARSNWESGCREAIRDDAVVTAHAWAEAAQRAGKRLAMVSSDAIFTGPWMFHDEESIGLCNSYASQVIRAAEAQVVETCPEALVVRTNVFGWSSAPGGEGWLETLLQEIKTRRIVTQDYIRHATPLLATDFADILDRALQERLSGVYHIAGAERCSPLTFAQRLADEFDLPWLAMRKESSLSEPPQGFGEGECSLQTKKIRRELCVAMPLLSEGLRRLHEQSENGYRERLQPRRRQKTERRAA